MGKSKNYLQIEDENLISKFLKEKNDDYFVSLVKKYQTTIKGLIYLRSDNHQYNEDCYLEFLMHLYQKLHLYNRKKALFKVWLAQVIRNFCKNFRRSIHRHTKRITASIDIVSEEYYQDSDFEEVEIKEIKEIIHSALNELSINDKILLSKFYLEEKSYTEISKELNNKPLGTLKGGVCRAKRKLRSILEKKKFTEEKLFN